MQDRDHAKAVALLVGLVTLVLAVAQAMGMHLPLGWAMGINAQAPLLARLLHPFIHVGVPHAALNVYVFLQVVFFCDIRLRHLLWALMVAVCCPAAVAAWPWSMEVGMNVIQRVVDLPVERLSVVDIPAERLSVVDIPAERLSVVDIPVERLSVVDIPVESPSVVGLSGVVFALMGMVMPRSSRRIRFCGILLLWQVPGLCLGTVAVGMHLYCFIGGVLAYWMERLWQTIKPL